MGFREHRALKAASIGLAFLLWLVVSGEETVERSLRIPMEFANVPSGLEVVGEPPGTIDIRLRGSSGLVGRTDAADLSAIVDLRAARPGRRLFPVRADQVRTPFGLDVVQVAPSTIAITFETSTVKTVPIVPVVAGDPAQGFVVGRIVTDPPVVELVGPASALKGVADATTEPISIAGASADLSEQVTVGSPITSVRLRTPTRARIQVSIVRAPVD